MPLPRTSPIPPQPSVQQGPLPMGFFQQAVPSLNSALLVYRSAALSIANGFVFTTIPFDTVESPTTQVSNSIYSTATGTFTVSRPGIWLVDGLIIFNLAAAFAVGLQVVQNGGSAFRLGTGYNGTANPGTNGSRFIRCSQGDTLVVQVAQGSATNPAALFTGSGLCYAQFLYWGPLS